MSQDLECELSDVEIRVYNHNVFFWSLAADPPLLWALHLIVQRQQLEHQKKIFSNDFIVVVLVSVLFILNIFHILFRHFHCWLSLDN